MRGEGQGYHHIIHRAAANDGAGIIQRAEHFRQGGAFFGVVIQKTGQGEAEVGLRVDLLFQAAANHARAEDEDAPPFHRLEQFAAEAQAGQQAPAQVQPIAQQDEEEEEEARDVAVGQVEHTGHRDGRQEGGQGERAEFVGDAEMPPPVINREEQVHGHPDERKEQVQLRRDGDGVKDVFHKVERAEADAQQRGKAQRQRGKRGIQQNGNNGKVDGKSAQHGYSGRRSRPRRCLSTRQKKRGFPIR